MDNMLLIGFMLGAPIGFFVASWFGYQRAGGFEALATALGVANRAKNDPAFAAKLHAVRTGTELKPAGPPKPTKPSGAPLRLLALLQAESRLVDFLLENIQGATDEQIGQAVREVHKKAQAALKQHLVLEPILPGNEDDRVTVPKGFDPSAIRVVGNVTGEPPFNGTIQHPGWKVKEMKLATPAEGADEFVIQPAEVQIA
ncbi:hypothetical protein GobsT_16280 [Gemmata obscuriglobus]|uniref:DUF2760 domain-containing protein n=1 Tax=Gemmata obscuriglobus TaxID=114 RepID=A0A2Z3HE35_9BACT|nr:DUF2760 domain-containing protein [Gemmata obscuriglobus]AWM39974.1 DUF2760 domain-containing protein [Gemmata obscuriglobus]QEG26880.1 hypothetical protein GobsT_16280 [Gemmata obscuriglobus]VTS02931.1 Uncharacterized protein OS=Candidatus Competibacter denitrificans Run_A_D11 GN=BN873_100013 PE=4 SV=1: DUF2760 [Gemmata obscuriglobus UQM 2246]